MPTENVERKLAAILSTDVKGYSRLMGEDEVGTLRMLTAYREVTDALIHQHRGRIVSTAGDSILAEFASAVEAVQCAVDIQQALKTKNADLPSERRMEFRIGINVGDVIVEGPQIYGDGVNIAARLEALAEGGGICLSGTVYDQVENKLPLGYEYVGEQMVKNIAKPVRVYRVQPEAEVPATDPEEDKGPSPLPTSALPLPDKPSIIVLPFTNMSNDPEQEYFSDGITEDITTDLSKISGLFVISRNSAFTYKGKVAKAQDISREMGVQYVREGSVRKVGERVRISAQLIDAMTDHHLWAERYDRDLTDIFELQDAIVRKIVGALAVELTKREQESLERLPTGSIEAYDFFLRGQEYYYRSTKEANAQARQMWEAAIELDPNFAGAYAWIGLSYCLDWIAQWNPSLETLKQGRAAVQRAIALDDALSVAHSALGRFHLFVKQYDLAVMEGERAIALNPNDAEAYANLGSTLNCVGRAREALGLVEKAIRLNPRCPAFYLYVLGHTFRLLGRTEEAIATQKRALARSPDFLVSHVGLAVMYSESDREQEARVEAAEILRIHPHFSLERWQQGIPFKDQVEVERVVTALRKGGLK
jgi:adenylate cyclase